MYDYNKPLKETDFNFISYVDNGRKKVLSFSLNGDYFREVYNYGNNYGFKFIYKCASEIAFKQGVFGQGKTIYSSTLPSDCTDEGRFIEYCLSKIDSKIKTRCELYQMNDKSNEDDEPVLVITDDDYLVHVGQPDLFKASLLAKYAKKGYKIETITIKEYRSKIDNWKWYWEKQN